MLFTHFGHGAAATTTTTPSATPRAHLGSVFLIDCRDFVFLFLSQVEVFGHCRVVKYPGSCGLEVDLIKRPF